MEVDGAAAVTESKQAKMKREALVDYTQEDDDNETLMDEPDELYDAEVDEKNDKWAAKQRRGRQTDAILSCPSCFITLCIDCQRHEKYLNQYRAMFVRNCKISHEEAYVFPGQGKPQVQRNSKRKRDADAPAANASNSTEVFRPVRCENCNADVAAWEAAEEIYHFYNVIPSYS